MGDRAVGMNPRVWLSDREAGAQQQKLAGEFQGLLQMHEKGPAEQGVVPTVGGTHLATFWPRYTSSERSLLLAAAVFCTYFWPR